MKIHTRIENGKVFVTSPYNLCFVSKARNLQGRWDNGAWVFPEAIADHVKNAVRDCYGVDGTSEYETCILLVRGYRGHQYTGGVELFGRPIAKAFGRDSGAKLSEGIIMLEGSAESGGSVKNWSTVVNGTFEIHGYPVAALEREDVKKGIADGWVEVKRTSRAKDEIRAEIEALEARIVELKAQLQ